MSGSGVLRFAEVCAVVFKKPRTCREIMDVTGIRYDIVKRYLRALQAEGIVYVSEHIKPPGGKRRCAPVYTWATPPSSSTPSAPMEEAPEERISASICEGIRHADDMHRFFFANHNKVGTSANEALDAPETKNLSASGVPA